MKKMHILSVHPPKPGPALSLEGSKQQDVALHYICKVTDEQVESSGRSWTVRSPPSNRLIFSRSWKAGQRIDNMSARDTRCN